MNRTIILLAIFVFLTSCDKVCQHPTLNRMVISNYVDSNCNSVLIKRYNSGADFTKLVDSLNLIVSSPTVNYTFTDAYDYLIIFYPISNICKIRNLKFAMVLGSGSSSTPCYSSYSYTANDSVIWIDERKPDGFIAVRY